MVRIYVGTRKGLFVLASGDERKEWELDGPHLVGWEVFHAVQDPRDGSVYAATNSFLYGGTVHRSTDLGATWSRAEEIGLPEDSGLKLEKTWHVEPGREDEPGRLWLGGAPGVLFRSDDNGSTWEVVESVLRHPTRDRWNPGAGGMCCHSIQLDPSEKERMYIGISAAGVFRSDDGGESWTPSNRGTAADFMPDPFPDVGQCVHKMLLHPALPDRLWQQNHCGVYRSDDRGQEWERLEGNGLPSGFGFPLALDPRDPDVAYVVPQVSGENRVTTNGRLGVYRTNDGGTTWELKSNGLPNPAWSSIMREGFSFDRLDAYGVYLGTQSGSIYVSTDEGETWSEAVSDLPTILSIEASAWP
jgi:BNR/Asp-box repeat